MRPRNGNQVLVAVPRWLSQVASSARSQRDCHDAEVALPADSSVRWQSVITGHEVVTHEESGGRSLTGQSLKVANLLEEFPVAFFRSVS
jgi:hypothetical protein